MVLVDIENTGFKINRQEFHKIQIELENLLKITEEKIYRNANTVFNINSNKQLQHVLFEILKLPVTNIKKTKNGYSTDEAVLQLLKILLAVIICISLPLLNASIKLSS